MSVYSKVLSDTDSATPVFIIAVADNPGEDGVQPPMHTSLCEGMYEWAADWLLGILGNADYPEGPPTE